MKALAKEAASYVVNPKKVLESRSSDEKKRFVRDFVAEAFVDGEKREIRGGFHDDENGPLRNLMKRSVGVGSTSPTGESLSRGNHCGR